MSTPEQARRELQRELESFMMADAGSTPALAAAIEALIDAKLAEKKDENG